MSQPVIVGVDTSERARDAVALGRLLAQALGAELVIAHAFPYDERHTRYAGVAFERLLRENAEQGIEPAAELAGPEARVMIVPDTSPARALHRLAERKQAQLLVTGSSHHGRIGSIFLGDVAHQTLHASPCAVAVAPAGYGHQDQKVGTIGVGFDAEAESRDALTFAAALARGLSAKLRLLGSAYVPPVLGSGGYVPVDMAPIQRAAHEDLSEQADEAAAAQAVECRGEVTDEPAIKALLGLSREVDLLILGSRRFGPVRRLLVGTTSDAVLRDAACPVLVLPRGADLPSTDDLPGEDQRAPTPVGAGAR